MGNRYPPLIEQFSEAKEAYNIVLGAMLGGYLALAISKKGVVGGSNFDLGWCLVTCCLFVLSVNLVGDRIHRRLFGNALFYAGLSLLCAWSSTYFARKFGIDVNVLITIFIVWAAMIVFEVATSITAIVKDRPID